MTRSASTPRLRLTLVWFVLLIAIAATAGRPPLAPGLDRALGAAALLLVALACLGRIWCSAFIAGRKDAELVVAGPYGLVRHPLYALSFIGAFGLGLATRSVVLTLATLVLLGVLFARAARFEEAALAQSHGASYRSYASATPRWWPRRWAWELPQAVTLHPAVFWKAFLDAGSFIVLYLAIDTARALRESGGLPTLLALP